MRNSIPPFNREENRANTFKSVLNNPDIVPPFVGAKRNDAVVEIVARLEEIEYLGLKSKVGAGVPTFYSRNLIASESMEVEGGKKIMEKKGNKLSLLWKSTLLNLAHLQLHRLP
ncbi:unnamed protein product [Cuscuta campestris]|uniref:Uncharacterized protein n=1 Tax=Cuscuta campestris TaxID=132261 RepID=A0A484KLN9_9ASTE|nr:unnamed protein product [Cuscuta campestris]